MSNADASLLLCLTRSVRFLLVPEQVAELIGRSVSGTYRLLAQLRAAGLVETPALFLRPPPKATVLARWEPGQKKVDVAAVAAQNLARWHGAREARSVTVAVATRAACRATGGRVRPIRPVDATHDALLSAAFLASPDRGWWQNGDAVRLPEALRGGGVSPDAWVQKDGLWSCREILGPSYTAERIRVIVSWLQERSLPYELW